MVIGALAGLLDEKLVKIIELLVQHPEKKFYLSEISKLSGVNTTSTFRIVNKLVKKDIIKPTIIGRVRVYQLAKSERALMLARMIKTEDKGDPLEHFLQKLKTITRIRMILLDSRTANSAKIIIISEYVLKDKINKLIKEFDNKNYKIEFVELTPTQFEGLKSLNSFGQGKKILYKKE